jgi:hypothetical protein
VVKFRRKRVTDSTLELAQRILADFNEQNHSNYGSLNSKGQPSEDLSRILRVLIEESDPPDFDLASRMIRWRLARPFKATGWDSKPSTGVVFGPGVYASNRESVLAAANGAGRFSEYDVGTRSGA